MSATFAWPRRVRRRLRRRGIGLLHVYVGLLLAFLFLPLAVLIMFSFSSSGQLRFPITGLSLRWYREVFGNSTVIGGIAASLGVAVATGLIVAAVGTLAAVAVNRYPFRGAGLVTALILAPAALPGLVIGIALLNFFGDLHLTLSLVTVTVGHVIYTLPYFYLVLSARLRRFDPLLEEAATDMGAGPVQRFRRVTAPLVSPAIIASAFVVLALSWDEFQITFFTIGDQSTLPLVIWSRARLSIDPSVNAIGTLMVAGSLLVVIFTRRFIADSYS
jgi:spermidine/putrescine transport system permease protein